MVINKMDLLPYLDFDLPLFYKHLADVHPGVTTIEVSAKTGLGLDEWCRWIANPDHDG